MARRRRHSAGRGRISFGTHRPQPRDGAHLAIVRSRERPAADGGAGVRASRHGTDARNPERPGSAGGDCLKMMMRYALLLAAALAPVSPGLAQNAAGIGQPVGTINLLTPGKLHVAMNN